MRRSHMTGLVNGTTFLDNSGSCIFYNSKAVVLKLSVTTSLGLHVKYLPYQIFTLGFITVIKLQLRSSNETNFMVGVITTWRTVLRRLRSSAPWKEGRLEQTAVTQALRRPRQEDRPKTLSQRSKQTNRKILDSGWQFPVSKTLH